MIQSRQYALTFRGNDSYRAQDYCVTSANSIIWDALHAPHKWSSHCAFLAAPAFGGKTHLSHVFAHTMKGDLWEGSELTMLPQVRHHSHICIDNVDHIDDAELLFHLYNKTKENEAHLLLTSSVPVSDFPHQLPDLTSRLKAAHLLTVAQPDEQLMHQIFMKRFADLQWRVNSDVLAYLLLRITRTFATITQIIDTLIPFVEENHRNITLPVMRRVLEQISASKDDEDHT